MAAQLLVTCVLAALSTLFGASVAELQNSYHAADAGYGRLLFRHTAPAGIRGPSFYTDLTEELFRGFSERRRLLADVSRVRVAALDDVTGIDVVEVPSEELRQTLLEALLLHPDVAFAEEDQVLSAFDASQPNDPDLPQQWPLFQLGLFEGEPALQSSSLGGPPPAWTRTEGSGDVTVCIIDSGIDPTHPDLQGNVWTNALEIPDNGVDDDGNGFVDDYHGFNFLNMTGNVTDDNFHGTHLAGIVGARTSNGIGVAGVSPQVKVMACKFLDKNGDGYTSDAIKCMSYALKMGAQITLNSYGGVGANSDALASAIDSTEAAGQLFVTAAGNEYGADIDAVGVYPASYNNANLLAVVAVGRDGTLAPYSNYGASATDIAAPGTGVLSTILRGGYGYHDGTSQAAGFVAGAAALLLAAFQSAGYATSGLAMPLKTAILESASPRASLSNVTLTGGVLDIAAAMALVPKNGVRNASSLYPDSRSIVAQQVFSAAEAVTAPAESPTAAAQAPAGIPAAEALPPAQGPQLSGAPTPPAPLTLSSARRMAGR